MPLSKLFKHVRHSMVISDGSWKRNGKPKHQEHSWLASNSSTRKWWSHIRTIHCSRNFLLVEENEKVEITCKKSIREDFWQFSGFVCVLVAQSCPSSTTYGLEPTRVLCPQFSGHKEYWNGVCPFPFPQFSKLGFRNLNARGRGLNPGWTLVPHTTWQQIKKLKSINKNTDM